MRKSFKDRPVFKKPEWSHGSLQATRQLRQAVKLVGADIPATSDLGIVAIFDRAGLSDAMLAMVLLEAMGATKNNQPDWITRLKASELALKVKGHFKERIEHTGTVGVLPILGGVSSVGADKSILEGEVVNENREQSGAPDREGGSSL